MSDQPGGQEPPTTLLHRLDGWVQTIEHIFNRLSGVVILAMMLIVVAEVLSRAFFNTPIPGQIDIIELLLPCAALLGIAYCHQQGSQIRMSAIIQLLKGRSLFIAELITTLAALVLFVFLSWATIAAALRARATGDTTMEQELITWPTKILIGVALCLIALRLVLQLIGFVRLVIDPESKPVGIPKAGGLDEFIEHRSELAKSASEERLR